MEDVLNKITLTIVAICTVFAMINLPKAHSSDQVPCEFVSIAVEDKGILGFGKPVVETETVEVCSD